jgi:lipid-A-disaccharide synthase-like uncharacterized protein
MSTMPESFWYFSFFGGIMLLAYACYRVDPVFIVGHFRCFRCRQPPVAILAGMFYVRYVGRSN